MAFNLIIASIFSMSLPVFAQQVDVLGPTGSGEFGKQVTVLPNGNFIVTDPGFDSTESLDVGAVYLYSPNAVLISTTTGSSTDDLVGVSVFGLANGNFVICSRQWDNGNLVDAGAATLVNGETGLSGEISTSNSLVGPSAHDNVCSGGITELTNGNYIVQSTAWSLHKNGGVVANNAGAATWVNGSTGLVASVRIFNSLVGFRENDFVGNKVIPLSNDNYVVVSSLWDNGSGAEAAGAATWGDGNSGISGLVSTGNSLIGTANSNPADSTMTAVALANGNYVVANSTWDNGATSNVGAVTWADGTTGIKGLISTANSLVGSTENDRVGNIVTALTNGNYVVQSIVVGATTWANGSSGLIGVVTSENSLVGGSGTVVTLNNGNYVMSTSNTATWGNGDTGVTGAVSAANSLVGNDTGMQVYGLSNGNYVVGSPNWDGNGLINNGAATWGDGKTGVTGPITISNSLVGGKSNDSVGVNVTPLNNGHYVVSSGYNTGAATWGNGNTGTVGEVLLANSLLGERPNDRVGQYVIALSDGNYVVLSPDWNNGLIEDVGAATWVDGSMVRSGHVTAENSLIGSRPGDQIGSQRGIAINAGFYLVDSPSFDFGALVDSGAVSVGKNLVGVISMNNSVHGYVTDGGDSITYVFNSVSNQVIVGQPASNLFSLFSVDIPELLFENSFE